MNCSDYSTAYVCRSCGSMISLGFDDTVGPEDGRPPQYCRICERGEQPGALDRVPHAQNVGIAAKGTPVNSTMDVIAVPCEFFECRQADNKTCSGISVPRWLVWASSSASVLPRLSSRMQCMYTYETGHGWSLEKGSGTLEHGSVELTEASSSGTDSTVPNEAKKPQFELVVRSQWATLLIVPVLLAPPLAS